MLKAKLLYSNPDIDTRLDRFELHTFVAPFPIVLLAGAFMADVASLYTVQLIWRPIAFWLLSFGLISGGVAALTGIIGFKVTNASRSIMAWAHTVGTTVALLLTSMNVALRLGEPTTVVTSTQLGLSTVVFLLLLLAGWLTGELVFRWRADVHAAAG